MKVVDLLAPYQLAKEPGKPMWKLVLEQFDDTLVRILLFAAFVSLALALIDGPSRIQARDSLHFVVQLRFVVEAPCCSTPESFHHLSRFPSLGWGCRTVRSLFLITEFVG